MPTSITMDQSSQKFQDTFLQYSVLASAAAALCMGAYAWSFKWMLIVYVAGVFLGMLVVVPDWDYFIKRPVRDWIEPMASDEESRKLQKERFLILKKTSKYAKREDIHPFGILFFLSSTVCSVYFTWKFVTS
eukprot:c12522_g1_i1 orf=408-803(-)